MTLIPVVHSIAQSLEWSREFGGYAHHTYNVERVQSLHSFGDHILAAIAYDAAFTLDSINFLVSAGKNNHALVVMDTNGHAESAVSIRAPATTSGNAELYNMVMDPAQNIYAAVMCTGTQLLVGDSTINLGSGNRMMVLKFNSDLELLWVFKTKALSFGYGNIQPQTTGHVEVDSTGKAALAIFYRGWLDIGSTRVFANGSSYSNVSNFHVIRLDAQGQVDWHKPIISTHFVMGRERSIYFHKYYSENNYNGSSIVIADSTHTPNNDSTSFSILTKLDSNGNVRMVKPIAITGYITLYKMKRTSRGIYLLGKSGLSGSSTFSGQVGIIVDNKSLMSNIYSNTFVSTMIRVANNDTVDTVFVADRTGNYPSSIYDLHPTNNPDEWILQMGAKNRISLLDYTENISSQTHSVYMLLNEATMSATPFLKDPLGEITLWEGYNYPMREHSMWKGASLYLGLGMTQTYLFQGDTLRPIPVGRSQGYILKIRDCRHLAPGISLPNGDTIFCIEDPVTLQAINPSEYEVQWLYNGTPITGANDSILEAFMPGSYTLEYSDSVCRSGSPAVNVVNVAPPNTTLNLPETQFCQRDSTVVLSGGYPQGGTYWLDGIATISMNLQNLSFGSHLVTYTFEDSINGCTDTASQSFQVNATPSVNFFQTFDSICAADTQLLNSGYPNGGTYSGNGVSGNLFIGSVAGAGLHTLRYTYTNSSGCAARDSISVKVKAVPQVSFNWSVSSTCEAHNPIAFDGYDPSGGNFSGQGVSGQYFIPGIVDPGTYEVSYAIDSGGCTGTDAASIVVDSFPVVQLPVLDSICEGADTVSLTHGFPSGGHFNGTHVSSNTFNVSSAGIGNHSIAYIFENTCAADTASNLIRVIANPVISFIATSPSCHGLSDGEIQATINGGNWPYQLTWSTGDSTSSIEQVQAGNYSLTIQGEGGCQQTSNHTLSQPDSLRVIIDSATNVHCFGFFDGKIWTSPNGGTAPYTYAWSGGQTTEDVSHLPHGAHVVSLTDQNGCSDSATVVIGQQYPILLDIAQSHISCHNLNDGAANVTPSGGNGPPFQINWSSGHNTSSISGLSAGIYSFIVTDTNNCYAVDSVEIAQPDSLEVTLQSSDPDCFLGANGVGIASPSGGRTPYTYLWSTGATTDSVAGLSAGLIAVTVTDSSGCTVAASDTLQYPTEISINFEVLQSIDCHGHETGVVAADVSGGTPTYNSAWSTGATTDTIVQLAAGQHSITVTDDVGCVKSDSFYLDQPDSLWVQIDSLQHLSCFGSNDGWIQISSYGGTVPHAYDWSHGADSTFIKALPADTFHLIVSDSLGCTANQIIELTQPDEITLLITHQDPACYGDSSGFATLQVSQQQGPYSSLWSHGTVVGDSVINLSAGWLSVAVADSAGCYKEDSVFLDQPDRLQASTATTDVLCHGDSNGSILAIAFGGHAPYTYSWSNGGDSNAISALGASSYQLNITDSLNCAFETTLMVNQPQMLLMQVDSIQNLRCLNDSSGYIALSAIGGTAGYSFHWSDSATTAMRTNLWADTFEVLLTDSNGCQVDTALVLEEPPALLASVDSLSMPTCFGDSNGYIAAVASGGTFPYDYAWSNGEGTNYIEQLVADTYTLTLTDAHNCETTIIQVVMQPDSLALNADLGLAHCDNTYDGSISLNPTGGTLPYDYYWSTEDTSAVIASLKADTYAITVSDGNGCTYARVIYMGHDFTAPVPNLGNDTALCDGEEYTLDPLTPMIWQHTWSTTDTASTILVQHSGTYAVTVTDTNACHGVDSITMTFNPLPVFSLGDDLWLCHDTLDTGVVLQGPAGMDHYLWSSSESTAEITVFDTGIYSLTATDANLCSFTDSIVIMDDTCLGAYALNITGNISISPNPSSGQFFIASDSDDFLSLEVYDHNGQLIQSTTHHQFTMLNLSGHPSGIYLLNLQNGQHRTTYKLILLD